MPFFLQSTRATVGSLVVKDLCILGCQTNKSLQGACCVLQAKTWTWKYWNHIFWEETIERSLAQMKTVQQQIIWTSNLSRVWLSGEDVRARERTLRNINVNVHCTVLQLKIIVNLYWFHQGPVEVCFRHAVAEDDQKMILRWVNDMVILQLGQVGELKEKGFGGWKSKIWNIFQFYVDHLSLISVPEDSRIRQADVKVELLVQRNFLLFSGGKMKLGKSSGPIIIIATQKYCVFQNYDYLLISTWAKANVIRFLPSSGFTLQCCNRHNSLSSFKGECHLSHQELSTKLRSQ